MSKSWLIANTLLQLVNDYTTPEARFWTQQAYPLSQTLWIRPSAEMIILHNQLTLLLYAIASYSAWDESSYKPILTHPSLSSISSSRFYPRQIRYEDLEDLALETLECITTMETLF